MYSVAYLGTVAQNGLLLLTRMYTSYVPSVSTKTCSYQEFYRPFPECGHFHGCTWLAPPPLPTAFVLLSCPHKSQQRGTIASIVSVTSMPS